jgi:hypothetical protein
MTSDPLLKAIFGMQTKTQTRTETRTTQLARQLNLFVVTATGSSTFREVIMRGAEERWIEKVFVRLLGNDEKIHQEAVLVIDWEQHSLALSRSDQGLIAEERFDPSTGWLGGALSELATDFAEFAREGSLTAAWSVFYTPEGWEKVDEIRKELGLVPGQRLDWAEGSKRVLWGPQKDANFPEMVMTWKGVVAPGEDKD